MTEPKPEKELPPVVLWSLVIGAVGVGGFAATVPLLREMRNHKNRSNEPKPPWERY